MKLLRFLKKLMADPFWQLVGLLLLMLAVGALVITYIVMSSGG